jgi:predicted acetyltransferase
VDIGPIPSERYGELQQTLTAAFGEHIDEKTAESVREIFDAGGTWGAYDQGDLVGVIGDNEFELTLPGGRLPVSAVHTVGVLPTQRRRGIMRELTRRQLEDSREAGRPISCLWASEGAIYQRVGYGMGTLAPGFEINRHETAFLRPVDPVGRIRLVDRREALKVIPTVYELVRPTRPGMVSQPQMWWEHVFRHAEQHHTGVGKPFFAVHESPEGPDGYAMYLIKDEWKDERPDQTLFLEQLLAANDDAYWDLWRYCFSVDLVRHITGRNRPIDEPLLLMLAEPRTLGFKVRDGAWLRILDVPEALEARRYAEEGRLRFDLRDELCPWNEGGWELEAGPEGASCRRTDAEPDLVLGVAELSSMYLGTIPASRLAPAGRVAERSDDALRRADAMFASPVAPWCPDTF